MNTTNIQRVAVVTGGAQGIGYITSLELLKAGYAVSVWENDKEALNQMRSTIENPKLLLIAADVSNEQQVKEAVSETILHFGRLDALINNAMIDKGKPIADLSLDEWNKVLSVNLTGPFLCVKYAEAELRRNKGSVINICSTRALQSEANTEAYSASKGGLLSLTHALAMSLGPDIRVNAISPGWIDVSAIKKQSAIHPLILKESDHAQHPAGRVGQATDISNMILFLLNPSNNFITAQNFIIDGGMTRKMIYEE